MNDKVYSVPDLMDRLTLSKSSVYRLLASGALRGSKIGGRTVVTARELHWFIARLETERI